MLDLAKADKQPALGIADTNNLFGALEFSEKAAGKGIQPLLGCELVLDFGGDATRSHERRDFGKGGVVLMAPMPRVSPTSRASSAGPISKASRAAPRRRSTGSSGEAIDGHRLPLRRSRGRDRSALANGMEALALERLDRLREVFGDRFYVELQRHGRHQEAVNEPQLIDYAYRRGVPLVATNEPFFPGARRLRGARRAARDRRRHRARPDRAAEAHRRSITSSRARRWRSFLPICLKR